MPYFLGGNINTSIPGLWGEGNPYNAETIYDISSNDPKLPPVNYRAHTLKPHSLTHFDAPSHIISDGDSIDKFFSPERRQCFFGEAIVARIAGQNWQSVANTELKLWRISKQELQEAVRSVSGSTGVPDKLIITPDDAPTTVDGYHDSNYVFVLSPEAANWLVSNPNFNLFGTSWKSSDFEPGSRERPIHKILLRQALLLEQIVAYNVPSGTYLLAAAPLCLSEASESPVNPILFTKEEIRNFLG